MLFAGHDRPQNEDEIRETTWKEVMHKASVKLRRVPLDVVFHTSWSAEGMPSASIHSTGTGPNIYASAPIIPADAHADEYAYQLMIIEDFDDDRYHEFEEDEAQPGPFDDVKLAGVREMIPIHEISKIFYADTSKVLNIASDAENNHPVLLLKRDLNAIPPRRMMDAASNEKAQDSQEFSTQKSPNHQYLHDDHPENTRDPWRLPPSLDPEWIALEVYTESEASDSDSELDTRENNVSAALTASPSPSNLAASLSGMNLKSSPSPEYPSPEQALSPSMPLPASHQPPWANHIRTSLSLLELLLRLTSLQQFQQQSHLSITDELLNFFLEEAASTGAGGDENYRQALRANARRRVGWDPYDESPVKRRGEEYLDRYAAEGSAYPDHVSEHYTPRSAGSSARGTPIGGSGLNGARRVSGGPSGVRPGARPGSWSPRDASVRSIPTMSDFQASPSPSPSPDPRPSPSPMPPVALSQLDGKNRARSGSRTAWLKREGGLNNLKGSPLRPSTGMTDEGIGTSPLSSTGPDATVPGGGDPSARRG